MKIIKTVKELGEMSRIQEKGEIQKTQFCARILYI